MAVDRRSQRASGDGDAGSVAHPTRCPDRADLMRAVQVLLVTATSKRPSSTSYLVWPPGVEPPDPRVLEQLVRAAALDAVAWGRGTGVAMFGKWRKQLARTRGRADTRP